MVADTRVRPEDIPDEDLRRTFIGVMEDDLSYAQPQGDEGRILATLKITNDEEARCVARSSIPASRFPLALTGVRAGLHHLISSDRLAIKVQDATGMQRTLRRSPRRRKNNAGEQICQWARGS